MTFDIRDTREGIELVAISVGGLHLRLTCGTQLTAAELVRLAGTEGVYLRCQEIEEKETT